MSAYGPGMAHAVWCASCESYRDPGEPWGCGYCLSRREDAVMVARRRALELADEYVREGGPYDPRAMACVRRWHTLTQELMALADEWER